MRVGVLALASCLALASGAPASAHVMVLPAASQAGGVERYTVVVPTEGTSPTVHVELRLPMGLEVAAVEARPGWQVSNEPFPIGAATLRWSGGRIAPGEMASFDFLALNPTAARELTWNAVQSYEDGTSDRWGEGAPPEHRASTTILVATSGGAVAGGQGMVGVHDARRAASQSTAEQHAGNASGAVERQPPPRHAAEQAPSPDPRSAAALWIALVALALSLTALLVTVVGGRRGAGS